MDMIETPKSSSIAAVGYDSEKNEMEVLFKGGGLYRYKKVPQHIFENMLNASSIGHYFHVNVKNFYEFVKLRG